jgi:hypothetical protein
MESKHNALSSFSWSDVNWEALKRLRARFLEFGNAPAGPGSATKSASADYWRSYSELASYDFTFAERIGWKWDHVLAELKARGWAPPEKATVLDWGCGTGVAGRRVIQAWGAEHFSTLRLFDRSKAALHFASQRAGETFPTLRIETTNAETLSEEETARERARNKAGTTEALSSRDQNAARVMVISHVINELDTQGLNRLLALVQNADTVLWVEPGTFQASRELIAVRERLLAQTPDFKPVAPCPHSQRCGMLTPDNQHHWCHHFAKAPRHIFQESGWGRFSSLVEVDLRTVPLSYLILDRRPAWPPVDDSANPGSRLIGIPRHYKGFDKILSCQKGPENSGEVRELTLQKRDAPELAKETKKDPGSLYLWKRNGEKIEGGTRVF